MNTSKLFHTVVVLGMSIGLEMACSSDTGPQTTTEGQTADASSSGSAAQGGGGSAAGATVASTSVSSSVSSSSGGTGGDSMAGWFCCG